MFEEVPANEKYSLSLMPVYFIPRVIFSSNCLHAVTFLYVLHLDVLRRQIEIETEIEN